MERAGGAGLLNVARWLPRSAVNGPGERFVLWLQGCGLGCPGCWNPDTHSFAPRQLLSVEQVMAEVRGAGAIEGVTLTGGEPLAQAAALVPLLRLVRGAGLSVMIFTGHEWAELRSVAIREVLAHTDILVSGRFVLAERDLELLWRGSRNQQVHFLSARYSDADLSASGQTEVHVLADGSVHVTGFPEARWLRQ